jgi:hypothetical protein
MQLAVASLVAVAIWVLLIPTQLAAPPLPKRAEVRPAGLIVSCAERNEICKVRKRMERVRAKTE